MGARGRGFESQLERFSSWATRITGSTLGFSIAAGGTLLWLLSGPLFHYSDTWQLSVNTVTTVVTFLMVFLIQRSQNKESMAVQLKLNELVASKKGASNRLIDIEDLDERELIALHRHYQHLVEMAKSDLDLLKSHSVEEAEARHSRKLAGGRVKTSDE